MQAQHDPDTPTAGAAATSSANVDEDIIALLYKIASIGRCLPLCGQVSVGCMVHLPCPGDASYALWSSGEMDARKLRWTACLSALGWPVSTRLACSICFAHMPAIKAAGKAGKQPGYALRPRTTGQHHGDRASWYTHTMNTHLIS